MRTSRREVLRRVAAALLGLVGGLLAAAGIGPLAGATEIHAHRGGPNAEGVAAFPENSMWAFRHALKQGWTIELDLMRSSDGVAVVMHDSTMDRTSDCDGTVASHTWAEIGSCELDVIGIYGPAVSLDPGDPRREPVPRLDQVLSLLKRTGGRANIEVKDLTNEFPEQVYRQIAASGVKARKVIIQNFAAPYLKPVGELLPGAGISLLTLNGSEYYFNSAIKVGANWISPDWFTDMTDPGQYVAHAHARGLKVVPWTIDEAPDLVAAAAAGVDAVISNDPTRAQRLVGPRIAPAARLALRVRRSGAARVRPGQSRRFTVHVANTGRVESGPVRLSLKFPSRLLRSGGAAKRVLRSVPAEDRATVRFRLRVRPGAKPKRKVRVVIAIRDTGSGSTRVIRRTQKLHILPRRK